MDEEEGHVKYHNTHQLPVGLRGEDKYLTMSNTLILASIVTLNPSAFLCFGSPQKAKQVWEHDKRIRDRKEIVINVSCGTSRVAQQFKCSQTSVKQHCIKKTNLSNVLLCEGNKQGFI